MIKNNGGNAFPKIDKSCLLDEHGMSLRDYFAAKAMQAMISTAAAPCMLGVGDCETYLAQGAYAVADAMLAERDKP